MQRYSSIPIKLETSAVPSAIEPLPTLGVAQPYVGKSEVIELPPVTRVFRTPVIEQREEYVANVIDPRTEIANTAISTVPTPIASPGYPIKLYGTSLTFGNVEYKNASFIIGFYFIAKYLQLSPDLVDPIQLIKLVEQNLKITKDLYSLEAFKIAHLFTIKFPINIQIEDYNDTIQCFYSSNKWQIQGTVRFQKDKNGYFAIIANSRMMYDAISSIIERDIEFPRV